MTRIEMTKAELAILGLIVEKPRHGYEIEQVIEQRGMRNWTEVGFSSIYYLLHKLQEEGLAEAQRDSSRSKGPARKTFRATRKGRSAWKKETRRALATHKRLYPPIYLGMAGIPDLELAEVITALGEYEEGLNRRMQEIAAARDRSGPDLPLYVEAMFTYGETLVEAERSWVAGFTRDLEAELQEQQ